MEKYLTKYPRRKSGIFSPIAAATAKQNYTGGGYVTGYAVSVYNTGSSGGCKVNIGGEIGSDGHTLYTYIPEGGWVTINTANGTKSIYLLQKGGLTGVVTKVKYKALSGEEIIVDVTSSWRYESTGSDGATKYEMFPSSSYGYIPKTAEWKNI